MLLQLEVSNYHDKLQPGSQCHVCTDYLSQGVDLACLQTGIGRVFFRVLNFENLYFFGYWSQLLYFLGC